jgi:ABC-type nitrate/sulfonate/bicarbonate transport system substrate-binding protein
MQAQQKFPGKPFAFVFAAMAAAVLSSCAEAPVAPQAPAAAPVTPVTLRVNVFRGSSNIPIYMARERGYFAKRAITTELQFTFNSISQRDGLAAGKFEIAHAAVDNAVAMVEVAKHDVVIVAGGESGMNEFLVRQDIMKVADLKGRTFAVDAPNTAYALVGRKIMKNAGLEDGKDYKLNPVGGSETRTMALDTPNGAAAVLNPPWNYIAKERGAKSLGRIMDLYGDYQATGVFLMRTWATSNKAVLERYLASYIEGCRAAQDPANREQVLTVLQRELQLKRDVAEKTYVDLMTPGHGLSKDCALNQKGFSNVLALRAEMEGQWGGTPPAPDKYLELSYYQRALQQVSR